MSKDRTIVPDPPASGPSGRRDKRTIRYQAIAEDLRRRIVDAEFPAGNLLPSEADLSAQYKASRVTVRRSLEALRADGLVDSRQGFGWFVAADPLRQDLRHLGTIEAQLHAVGIESARRILSFSFITAPAAVAATLGTNDVLEVQRLNLADGQPFAVVTVWCPADLGAQLSRADVERSSFLEQLPVEIGGASQTIGARAASAEISHLLDIPLGSPVLVAERVTRTNEGRAVLMSRHVFAGHRTEFAVELPAADAEALGPTGLRLVDDA